MARTSTSVCLLVLVAALMGATLPGGGDAVLSCSTVYNDLSPCISYLSGAPVTPECCSGVHSLLAAASTAPDRQAVCSCLKSISGGVAGPALSRAAEIPGKCGLSLPYKLSPSTNCAKIK